MNPTVLIAIIGISFGLFAAVLVTYLILQKRRSKDTSVALQKMVNSSSSGFTMGSAYQKVYNTVCNIPVLKRYVYKIRRRLELLSNDDEYMVRGQTGKITLQGVSYALLAAIGLAWINREDLFMMIVSLIGVIVVIENLTDMMVNKVEDKLLRQQLDLFSEIRHSFHETNMVEEAIYDAALMGDYEVTLQADRIYEILISAEPELELEKYYDVAPNRFLKAFAGVSYLTKEFGDRKVNDMSLYLKNMNNITQELQLEILKRDKLDYLFRSLTFIALAPIVCIIPLKNWAMSSFESTMDFYEGKLGFVMEMVLLILIFVCYGLLRRIKDNSGRINIKYRKEQPWQEKVYRTPIIEQLIDKLMPNVSKREYVKIRNLLKETSSPLRIEWLYVNRLLCAVLTFFAVLLVEFQLHNIATNSVMYDATVETTILGQMDEKEKQAANTLTAFDRYFIKDFTKDSEILDAVRNSSETVAINTIKQKLKKMTSEPLTQTEARVDSQRVFNHMQKLGALRTPNKTNVPKAILDSGIELPREDFVSLLTDSIMRVYRDKGNKDIVIEDIDEAIIEISKIPLSDDQLQSNAERIYGKLQILTSEYLKWTEIVVAILLAFAMYSFPVFMLSFQKKMRQMEMEDEVMQFQTIILMLMYIERVSVEYIIEWLERFSNIFKEPLATCLNNYESGAWQALEQLKEDAPFKPFVRIVESLQSAVENVKIADAFDELESERAFYQEKRKEANERLIAKKTMIGKVVGFTPMIFLFVVYLIGPLMWVSIVDMGSYFSQMGTLL